MSLNIFLFSNSTVFNISRFLNFFFQVFFGIYGLDRQNWPSRLLVMLCWSTSLSSSPSSSSAWRGGSLTLSSSSPWAITSGRVVLLPPRGLFLLCRLPLCCFGCRDPTPVSARTTKPNDITTSIFTKLVIVKHCRKKSKILTQAKYIALPASLPSGLNY